MEKETSRWWGILIKKTLKKTTALRCNLLQKRTAL
jgi:hypothetical protein